ncbi:MAG: hypothetical protein P8X74_05290 [Reinekea sp.]
MDCAPDRSGYVKRIISPYGMSFYYPNAPLLQSIAKTVLTNITYPSLVVDANGNEMSIDYQSNKKVVFKTKYQTVTLTNKELRVSGYPEPIVSYDYNPDGYKGYKVSYAGDSDWTFSAIPGDKTKVCNPLKTCAVYEFKDVTLQGLSHRVIQKKTYTIPHFGHYEVKYTYSDSSGVRNLTVNYPDHVREYSFHDGKMETSLDLTRSWKYGLPISEEVWDKDKTGKLQEITYRHEPSSNWKLFDGKAIKLQKINPIETRQALIRQSNYKPEARMIEKTTKRWAKNDAGQMVWVGTVQEKYSDFTSHNQPQKTTFSYPDTTWSQLFPSVTYVSHYYADHPSHNINLVRETYIEGSSEKTEQTYDNAGNIKTQTVNGLTTRFDYSSNGEMTRMMDPEGNIRTYSQFKFGIPTQETGPEGFTASRTVKNGFVTSETTWGNRTVHYKFDPFGKLTEYQPAGRNRFPIRYYYQYPADGGLELVEQNGNLTKHSYLNGFGKPYKVLTEGLGTGSGAGYAFKKEFEYFYDGSVKSESAMVGANTTITPAQRTTYTQDPTGRRIQLDPADDAPIRFEYPSPFMTKMIDSMGVVTEEYYRPFAGFGSEQLIKRYHPRTNKVAAPSPALTIDIDYLNDGKLDTVKVDKATQYYNYNDEGLLKSYSTPETGLVQFRYSKNGNLIWEKHNNDSAVSYEYDHLNRIIKKIYSDTTLNVDYSYDDINRTNTVEKASFGWKYSLNEDGLVEQAQLMHKHKLTVPSIVNEYPVYTLATGRRAVNTGTSGFTRKLGTTTFEYYQYEQKGSVSHNGGHIASRGYLDWLFKYDYDTQGFLSNITYPDGEDVGYLRNSMGQATQVGRYVSNIEYWPNGAVKKIRYDNGISSEFKQDSITGKLNAIQHGNFWHKQYGYLSASYVNSIVDVLDNSKSIYMDYDQLHQLRKVHQAKANGTVVESFSYNATGDMTDHYKKGVGTTRYSYAKNNRLSAINKANRQLAVGYTPDGRITVFGDNFYGYSDDKLLTQYDTSNGDLFTYLYDGNDKKLKTLKNGELLSYSIYDHTGKLIYEEKPGDVTSNLIYLDGRLIAKRDGKYDIAYTECNYIEDKKRFETTLWHRPVYLHKQSHEPVSYGDCERYGRWVHDFDSSSGLWQNVSESKREYRVWINQYAITDTKHLKNQGALYKWLYKDMYVAADRMERRYSQSGTKRKYQCFRHYKIIKRTYNLKTGQYTSNVVKTGNYYTGRQIVWRMWKKKPKNFGCQNPGLVLRNVVWPNMSGQ